MTTHRIAFALAVVAAAAWLAGCESSPPPRRTSFLQNNPWVVKKPGEAGRGNNAVVQRPEGAVTSSPQPGDSYLANQRGTYKADTEIVSPILEAKGNWTVRLAFYNPTPQDGRTALHYANQHARALREKGYDAYVTDFISKAIVSVGAFEREDDPKLIDLWRECYDDWLKIYQGRKSPFRQTMEQFYGGETVFGDQPWPVAIVDLQIKMKNAYRIPITPEDQARYKEYISKRAKTGENS
jgi:hypothetical protein